MYKDIDCPYCGHGQDICHDDGFGYEEDTLHQEECCECEKTFTFITSISFSYEPRKADCLNNGKCLWKSTITIPVEHTKMECETCEERRKPTEEEMNVIMKEYNK